MREDWYGFTVGVQSAVPEASTWTMMILGFAAVGFIAYSEIQASIDGRLIHDHRV